LERFNREIGRRTDVVGIFPDDASVIRLVSMLAIEANDEWLVGRSYISRQSMATLYETRSALAPKRGCCTKGFKKLWHLTGGRRIAIHRPDEVLVPLVRHLRPF
jgi:hypothetical protein